MPDKLPLPSAIILGAIASATAPAATLMVVRQYKAKGPLTDTLLPVVALDDAVGLILFSISFGIAKALVLGTSSLLAIILEPIIEVLLSLLLGAFMGYAFTFFERFFHSRSKRLSMSVAFVLLTVAVSMIKFEIPGLGIHVGFSSLLSCMMLGTIFCNICDFSAELMDRLDRWTAPIFILFFVLSGAELNLSVLTDYLIVLIGLVYIIFRCLGKYFGAGISACMVRTEPTIKKYLGITLFPQAGVALGMAIKSAELAGIGSIISNIILFSVLIYEIVGPFLTKISLTKAGEIDINNIESARGKPHI
jgi:Kef-type K+ transport system membrane component KefB